MLTTSGMKANLVVEAQGRCVNLASNTVGKLLWVARSHGWHPPRAAEAWAADAWDTELILPRVESYFDGFVSESDAEELSRAFRRILAEGDTEMTSSMYLALLLLLRVADQGEFNIHHSNSAPQTTPDRG